MYHGNINLNLLYKKVSVCCKIIKIDGFGVYQKIKALKCF